MKQVYLAMAAGVLMAVASGQHVAAQTPTTVTPVYPNLVTSVSGEHVESIVSGYAIWPNQEQSVVMGLQYDGRATEIVYGDDGDVYFSEPFSRLNTSTYMRGTFNETKDEIEVKFPQRIYMETQDGKTANFYICVMQEQQIGGASTYVMAPTSAQSAKFVKNGEKWELVLNHRFILGEVDEKGTWYYYGEYDLVYEEFKDKALSLPAGLKSNVWTMSWSGDGREVNVAFNEDNTEIYVQGISEDFRYGWVKGSIEGDKVIMPSNQYLGVNWNNYYTWVTGAKREFFNGKESIVLTDNIEWSYNAEQQKLTYPDIILVNCSRTMYFPWEMMENVLLFDPAYIDESYEPAKPEIIDYYPKIGKWGSSWVTARIPKTSVAGNLLDTEKLDFRVFVNGEPYVFEPDGKYYLTLDAPMEYIPYNFDDNWDFTTIEGISHKIAFYIKGIEDVGIQSYYHLGDEVYASEMDEWKDLPQDKDGVEAVSADKQVKSVKYFDLAGSQVLRPENGVFIKIETYADGSRRARKLILK